MCNVDIICGTMGVIIALMPSMARAQTPCFVFVQGGDGFLDCGRQTQITHRGDLEGFVVSDIKSSAAYVTSRTAGAIDATDIVVSTVTIVDLKSRVSRDIKGVWSLVSTCGGMFALALPEVQRKSQNLLTGNMPDYAPYDLFRCSTDGSITVGKLKNGELWEGRPPRMRIAAASDFGSYQFNISADGSQVAFCNKRLCVYSSGSRTTCIRVAELVTGIPSVSDSGEVLVSIGTGGTCFYRTSYSFSRKRFEGATDENKDECLGIGYWKPGADSVRILEPLGRDPQWIEPSTAELLRAWSGRELDHRTK